MRSVLVILSPTHAKDRVCETSKKGAATAQYHSFAHFFQNFFFYIFVPWCCRSTMPIVISAALHHFIFFNSFIIHCWSVIFASRVVAFVHRVSARHTKVFSHSSQPDASNHLQTILTCFQAIPQCEYGFSFVDAQTSGMEIHVRALFPAMFVVHMGRSYNVLMCVCLCVDMEHFQWPLARTCHGAHGIDEYEMHLRANDKHRIRASKSRLSRRTMNKPHAHEEEEEPQQQQPRTKKSKSNRIQFLVCVFAPHLSVVFHVARPNLDHK